MTSSGVAPVEAEPPAAPRPARLAGSNDVDVDRTANQADSVGLGRMVEQEERAAELAQEQDALRPAHDHRSRAPSAGASP